jgi:hypothetical protein
MGFRPWRRVFAIPDFPKSNRLGRVCEGKIEVKALPDYDSQTVDVLYEDAVVPWLKEVVGHSMSGRPTSNL